MERIIYVLSALGAAVWSVWTWSKDQQKERQLRRDQEAALYINSTLLALGQLKLRLYKILEESELAFYKKEYPDKHEFGSPAAIEILYHFGQCFGWAHRTIRYGPYTKDPRVIELLVKIGETFESRSRFPGDAFRFNYDERASLGEAAVRRVGEATAILPVFESIPLHQFEEKISEEQGRHAPLIQSKAVRCTLAAIDRADGVESLEGHERLAVLHNLFVELLEYLEGQEGFRVSTGEHKRVRLEAGYAPVSPARPAMGGILHQTHGRIRIGIPRLKTDRAYANRLQSLLETVENVTSVRISVDSASVIINYNQNIGDEEFASKVVKTIETGRDAGSNKTIEIVPI